MIITYWESLRLGHCETCFILLQKLENYNKIKMAAFVELSSQEVADRTLNSCCGTINIHLSRVMVGVQD